MKKILLFDTETTWISWSDKIIQIAIVFGELDLNSWEFYTTRTINQYINTDVPISDWAYAAHKIEKSTIAKFSKIDEYLPEIMSYFNKADLLVAHNFSFDHRMLLQEILATNSKFAEILNNKPNFCTMKSTVEFCWLTNSNWKSKRPKLSELYFKLFWKWFDNAHDALSDTLALRDCFVELVSTGVTTIS